MPAAINLVTPPTAALSTSSVFLCSPNEQVQMVKDIQQSSRQLNKRQMTWFRDDSMYLWLDAKQPVDKLVDQIASSLAEAKHVGMFWSVGVMCVSSTCVLDVSVQNWYCCGIRPHVCCSLHSERWQAPCLADTVTCDACDARRCFTT